MARNNNPVTITPTDVENKTLLVRALRDMSDRLSAVEDTNDAITTHLGRTGKTDPTAQAKTALESNGSNPLNIQNLQGVASEPQLSKLPILTAKPAGLALQQLPNGHIFSVKNGAVYQVWMVIGGNPNTLFQLI